VRTIRVAAHIHSEWSYDGRWTIDRLVSAFRRRGYDALLMAEHDLGYDGCRWQDFVDTCRAASTPAFAVVPGIEYSDDANRVHIAVWGAAEFLGAGLETLELLHRARDVDALTALAHPGRRDAWKGLDSFCFSLLWAIEVWNRKYDGWAPSGVAQKLLRQNPGLAPFAGLDFHTARQFFPLAMRLQGVTELSAEGVVNALKAGRCEAQVFRQPITPLTHGLGLATARRAEHGRRALARGVRRAHAKLRPH
jgi:hypothetical protein